MVDRPHRTLLRPGADEWGRLNEEKRRLLIPSQDTPIDQLLREGEALSAEAMHLIASIRPPSGQRPARSA